MLATLFRNRAAAGAFIAFVFLVLCADLKVAVDPHIHWLIAMPLILWALLSVATSPFENSPLLRYTVVGAGILVFSVAVLGGTAAQPIYAFGQAVKLAVILAVVLPFLCKRRDLIVPAHIGFGLAVVVNAAFVGLGLLGFEQLASIYAAEGRWGTVLNLPGSLSRLGLLLLVFCLYLLTHLRHLPLAATLYVASCLLVLVDGSRTSVSLLVLGHLVGLGIITAEHRGRAIVFVPLLALALCLAFFLAVTFTQDDPLPSALQRLTSAMEDDSSFATVDPQRQYMNDQAWRLALQSPFIGPGLNTILTPVQGTLSTIHNTYLQLFAEVSLLATVGFFIVVLAWFPGVTRVLRAIATMKEPVDRALAYNALFLCLAFPIAALFHPLSSEWSEWLPLLVAYSIVHSIQVFRLAPGNERLGIAPALAARRASVGRRGASVADRPDPEWQARIEADIRAMVLAHDHQRGNGAEFPLTWSIVIATRNRSRFLARALASIGAAGVPATIVVVDDASDDDTQAVCRAVAGVRYLRNDTRRGPGASRNRGLDMVSSDMALILDDDDELLPGALETASRSILGLANWRHYPAFQFAHGSGRLDEDFVLFRLETYFSRVYRGDFVPCINVGHPDFGALRYPPIVIGAEHLLWWEVADRWGIPTWATRIGTVHDDAPQRQTSVESQIGAARVHARAVRTTLARFGKRLARRAPSAYAGRYVAAAVYEVLSGNRRVAWVLARRLWRKGRRGASLKAGCISLVPEQAMRMLLAWYRHVAR